MKKILGILLVVSLCSCGNSEDHGAAINGTDSAGIVPPEPAGADAAAGSSVLTGSLAGYYVESFAGANSHSYEFKFANGTYTGVYEEHQDGEQSRVILKDVAADEAARTLNFDQNGVRLTGIVTGSGLELGEELFERRE